MNSEAAIWICIQPVFYNLRHNSWHLQRAEHKYILTLPQEIDDFIPYQGIKALSNVNC